MKNFLVDSRGTGILGCMVLLVLVTFEGSFLGLQLSWRHFVKTQLRLDRCLFETSQKIRSKLKNLEQANDTIARLREMIAAARLSGVPAEVFQSALVIEVSKQEVIRLGWEWDRVQWDLKQGCAYSGDRARAFPILPFYRKPADVIGPQILEWPFQKEKVFSFKITHKKIASAMEVRDEGRGHWKGQWVSPETKSNFPFSTW